MHKSIQNALNKKQNFGPREYAVFVYGSLRIGFGNNRLLSGSKYLGSTQTIQNYAMVDLGSFPGVIKQGENRLPVVGDVYIVNRPVLADLDRLEGNGSFYNREQVNLENGMTAWMYFLMREYGLENEMDSISTHDWATRRRKSQRHFEQQSQLS